MVTGLELFKEHFRPYADNYVLIGGTACELALEEAGLPFRATKDLAKSKKIYKNLSLL